MTIQKMTGKTLFAILGLLVLAGLASACATTGENTARVTQYKVILPEVKFTSDVSVEEALLTRRSVREYSAEAMTLAEVGQLLWAAQGVTSPDDKRTAPSAGATYPLEVYVLAGNVVDLEQGVYHYLTGLHQLDRVLSGDSRDALSAAALGQKSVAAASAVIVIAADYERTTKQYGERGSRYVHMEVGHAAQNVCLQAVSLDLGAVTIGAFDDDKVKQVLDMPENQMPLYIIPVGRPAG